MREEMNENERDLTHFLNLFSLSQNWKEPYIKKHKEYYKLYRSYKTQREKIYTHDIFVPYTFAVVEDYVAKTILSLISDEKLFSVKIRGKKFAGSQAEKLIYNLEDVLDFLVSHPSTETILELADGIKNCAIYGFSANYCYPFTDERGNFLRPVLDNISFFDLFPDPHAKRLSRATFVIVRSIEYVDKLLKMRDKGIYDHFEEIDLISGFEDSDWRELLTSIGLEYTPEEWYDPKTRRAEILDVLTPDGNVVTILGRRKIIRDTTKDPIKPFVDGIPIIGYRTSGAPKELLGISLVEQMRPLQEELNLIRSQRRENIAIILNKIFKVNVLADIDFDTLFSAPGNIILTTDMNAIQELPMSDVTSSSYREEASLLYDIQNVTASTDYSRGMPPRRRETATGILSLQKMAQGRFEYNLKLIDLQLMTRLAQKLIILVHRYMDKEMFEEIVGKDNAADLFYSLSPQEIMNYLTFVPMTSSITQVKEVNRQHFIQAFPMLAQAPEVNRLALIKKFIEMFDIGDIDELLPAIRQQPGGRELASEIGYGMQNRDEILKKLLAGRETL